MCVCVCGIDRYEVCVIDRYLVRLARKPGAFIRFELEH